MRGRLKVPLRQAALAAIARRELGLSGRDAARLFSKGEATIGNWEQARYALSDETARRIIGHYIRELSRLAGTEVAGDLGELSIEGLTERLGLVLLARYAARVGELLAAVQSGGLDQALDFVVAHGLRADVVNSKFAAKMRTAIYQKKFFAKRDAAERAEAGTQA